MHTSGETVRIYKGSSRRRFSQVRRFRRNSKLHTAIELRSNWRENICSAYTLLVIQNIANPLIPFLRRATEVGPVNYSLHRICIKRKRNSPLSVFTWITRCNISVCSLDAVKVLTGYFIILLQKSLVTSTCVDELRYFPGCQDEGWNLMKGGF